jgi:hypothetical protein
MAAGQTTVFEWGLKTGATALLAPALTSRFCFFHQPCRPRHFAVQV